MTDIVCYGKPSQHFFSRDKHCCALFDQLCPMVLLCVVGTGQRPSWIFACFSLPGFGADLARRSWSQKSEAVWTTEIACGLETACRIVVFNILSKPAYLQVFQETKFIQMTLISVCPCLLLSLKITFGFQGESVVSVHLPRPITALDQEKGKVTLACCKPGKCQGLVSASLSQLNKYADLTCTSTALGFAAQEAGRAPF